MCGVASISSRTEREIKPVIAAADILAPRRVTAACAVVWTNKGHTRAGRKPSVRRVAGNKADRPANQACRRSRNSSRPRARRYDIGPEGQPSKRAASSLVLPSRQQRTRGARHFSGKRRSSLSRTRRSSLYRTHSRCEPHPGRHARTPDANFWSCRAASEPPIYCLYSIQ